MGDITLNLHILDHPLIQNKLTHLRDASTNNHNFRLLLEELTALMVYEITRHYPLREVEITTPLERTAGKTLDVSIVLIPILRAGTGMLRGVLELLPTANQGGSHRHLPRPGLVEAGSLLWEASQRAPPRADHPGRSDARHGGERGRGDRSDQKRRR